MLMEKVAVSERSGLANRLRLPSGGRIIVVCHSGSTDAPEKRLFVLLRAIRLMLTGGLAAFTNFSLNTETAAPPG